MEIVAPLSVFAGTQNQPYPEVESSPLRNEGVYYNPFSDTLGPSDRYLKYSGDVLGKGAFKTVYRAFDLIAGREVAWNEVVLDTLEPMASSKLFQEIKALKDVDHENIIKLYDHWFEGSNLLIFTTELMPSGCLKKYLKKNPTALTTPVLKSWALQILEALNYMHTCQPKIIHRDIKAQNIFINGATGVVKVGDLGLCASLGLQSTAVSCIGTPEFMAPETYSNAHYDEKVDIYAFGMLLLELITRDTPYLECANIVDVLKKVEGNIPPNGLNKVVHKEMKDLILLCINKDPSARPSARELLSKPFLSNMSDTGKLTTDAKDHGPSAQVSLGTHEQTMQSTGHTAVNAAQTALKLPQQSSLPISSPRGPQQSHIPQSLSKPVCPASMGVSVVNVAVPTTAVTNSLSHVLASETVSTDQSGSILHVPANLDTASSVVIKRRPTKSSLTSRINVEISLPNQVSFVYVLSLMDKPVEIVDELEMVHDNVGLYREELLVRLQQFLDENMIDKSVVDPALDKEDAPKVISSDSLPAPEAKVDPLGDNQNVDEQFTCAMQELNGYLMIHTDIIPE
ncbi:Kinase, WNK [Giardia duodenalis]|uniref:Kinase, WNK n=2 Tax=Giardia intestinalis TaxID=5741 RepID=A8BMJ8_GIAIC|nr:Kinase, WNK [Giardia intestinalis]ESU36410.1 Serine/threonine protein kinase [Giardia intestinalis]KAE8304019.1 Kinase, WNK [Giardia intestinalis]|eukprot:XP_001706113.1 Kinase, Wnk [Giardia lamblia ATCC 50803]